MADYWKSQDKYFCDVCKCWLADNKVSIEFHKGGKRHKEAVEKRLKDIHKKNKADDKKEKKFNSELAKIEQAAVAACKAEGYDYSSSISSTATSSSKSSSSVSGNKGRDAVQPLNIPGVKVLHRKDEKSAKEFKPVGPSKTTGTGSWAPVGNQSNYADLELPGGPRQSRPGSSTAKPGEKRKFEFEEKKLPGLNAAKQPIVTTNWAPVAPKIEFKKRKPAQANVRRREDDD